MRAFLGTVLVHHKLPGRDIIVLIEHDINMVNQFQTEMRMI